jgi:5'-methylthioadenosine phosphorylase
MSSAQVAVIGGSGFYQMHGLSDVEEISVDTPFGSPSESILLGTLAGVRVAFLARHGAGHRILPGEVPYQANIWALKRLGVERIISISAVGSLREEIAPLHFVVPDQIIDRTRGRPSTFFGDGLVAHIAFHEPFCPIQSQLLANAAQAAGATVHWGATYVAVEGPSFSTKAESQLHRSWGADIIGMTALPEAKLAREAELCYATLAFVTDYDTWDDTQETVTAEMIVQNVLSNVATARQVVSEVIKALPPSRECDCGSALATALITHAELVPEETKRKLAPIIGRYMAVEVAQ